MSSRAARGGDSSSEHYGGQTAAESSQSVCLDAASSVANAATKIFGHHHVSEHLERLEKMAHTA
jgi:hypothetical protein